MPTMPLPVTVDETRTPVTFNEPIRRLAGVCCGSFPPGVVSNREPATSDADFNRYSRTDRNAPGCTFCIGGSEPVAISSARQHGELASPEHVPLSALLPEPTLKAAIVMLAGDLLELLPKR